MSNLDAGVQVLPSPGNGQTKQKMRLSIVAFAGLMFAFAGIGGLFFLEPMALYERSGYPCLAIAASAMAIAAFVMRKNAGFLAGKNGSRVLISVSFAFGCIAPLGVAFPASAGLAVPLSAFGSACILFQWWSHLCLFEHRYLMTFTSASLLAGAVVVFILSAIGVGGIAGIIAVSLLLFAASLLLCFAKNDTRDALCAAADSSGAFSRLRSKSMHRLGEFNYFGVGFLAAVAAEVAIMLAPSQESRIAVPSAVLLGAVIACLVCFFAHYRSNFDIERFSKSYFALACIIGFLPIPYVTGVWLDAAITYLLAVLCLQALLIVLAVIELARFEEISPFWYAGEGVFLFGGIAIGAFFAKAAFLLLGIEAGILAVCSFAIVFVSFAQVLLNRVTYPEIELFVSGESAGSGSYREDDEGETPIEENLQDASSGGEEQRFVPRFRNRVKDIERAYRLSPRQCEVLELLAKGRDVGYIVHRFQISRSTAKTHIYNIYLKLDIHSRQELFDLIEGDEPLVGTEALEGG